MMRPGRRRETAGTAALFVILGAAFVALGLLRPAGLSTDAVVMDRVCARLRENTTVGRQALVSSVWWPPLATLLRLPLGSLLRPLPWLSASLLIGAAAGAAVLCYIERELRRSLGAAWRALLLAGIALHPAFVSACTDGSSTAAAMLLALVAGSSLAGWLGARRLRRLVYLGLAAGLGLGVSFEISLWMLLVFLLLAADLGVCEAEWGEKQATLILAWLPAVYAALLWPLLNWLTMGDPLYFLRSLWRGPEGAAGRAAAALRWPDWVAVGVGGWAVLLGLVRRRRAAALLGVLALGLTVCALVLESRGLLLRPSALLATSVPMAALALGHGCAAWPRRLPLLRPVSLGLPAGLAVFALASHLAATARSGRIERGLAGWYERGAWLPRIERHVRRRGRHPTVFVCGYRGFELLPDGDDGLFVQSLDFGFHKAMEDYRGRDLFLLVRRPSGLDARDSIHWRFPRLYRLGGPYLLYDGDWGDWRLFEIVTARNHLPGSDRENRK